MAQTLRRTAVQARGRNGYVGFSSLVRSAIFDAARERDECKVVSDHEIHVQLQTAVLQLSVPKLEDPSSDFQVLRHFVLPVEARDVGKVTILARDVFPELDHRVFTASAAKDATSGRVTVSTPYVYVAFMSNAIHREPQLGTVISEARSVEEALFIARTSERALEALVLLENAPHTPKLDDLRRAAIALVRSNAQITSGMDLLEQTPNAYSWSSDGLLETVQRELGAARTRG